MLKALTTLLLCQFVGEILTNALGLLLPGPVLGLVFLLVLLIIRDGPDREMKTTSQALLQHLSLLFVPAGVGVVTQLDILAANWLPVTAALLVSTALGLMVTGWVMQHLAGAPEP